MVTPSHFLTRGLNSLGDDVYITIDIDGFDPPCAPGTGTPEPGGLDWHQVTALQRLVAAEKNVVAADVVEVTPIPGQVVTEFLAARLAYSLMCYVRMRMSRFVSPEVVRTNLARPGHIHREASCYRRVAR